jgi:hypothetical protein
MSAAGKDEDSPALLTSLPVYSWMVLANFLPIILACGLLFGRLKTQDSMVLI